MNRVSFVNCQNNAKLYTSAFVFCATVIAVGVLSAIVHAARTKVPSSTAWVNVGAQKLGYTGSSILLAITLIGGYSSTVIIVRGMRKTFDPDIEAYLATLRGREKQRAINAFARLEEWMDDLHALDNRALRIAAAFRIRTYVLSNGATTLDLSNLGLRTLPDDLEDFPRMRQLTQLDLRFNLITFVNNQFNPMCEIVWYGNPITNIQYPRLLNNRLEFERAVPLNQWALASQIRERREAVDRILEFSRGEATHLDLSNLALTDFPPGFFNLPRMQELQTIDLAGNRFPEPSAVQGFNALAQIRELQGLDEAQIPPIVKFRTSLNRWRSAGAEGENRQIAADRILACYRANLQSVNLQNLGLRSLPDCLGQMPHLQRVNALGNPAIGCAEAERFLGLLVDHIHDAVPPPVAPAPPVLVGNFGVLVAQFRAVWNVLNAVEENAEGWNLALRGVEAENPERPFEENKQMWLDRIRAIKPNATSLEADFAALHTLDQDNGDRFNKWLQMMDEKLYRRLSLESRDRLLLKLDEILTGAAENVAFRRALFEDIALSFGCVDRMSYYLNKFAILRDIYCSPEADTKEGFSRFALQYEKMDMVEKIATEVAGDNGEALEIVLYYQTKLAASLGFPVVIDFLHYDNYAAGITQDMLDQAMLQVFEKTAPEMDRAWVLSNNSAWQKLIRAEDVEFFDKLDEECEAEAVQLAEDIRLATGGDPTVLIPDAFAQRNQMIKEKQEAREEIATRTLAWIERV